MKRLSIAFALAALLAAGTAHGATQISCGSAHCLALADDGSTKAWGNNVSGEATVPSSVDSAGEAVYIAAGGHTSCAIDSTGAVRCWGLNTSGQATPPSSVDGSSGNDASHVAVGTGAACAIRTANDGAVCWGASGYTPPASVDGSLGTASAIAVGDGRACVIRAESSHVVCWGPRTRGGGPAYEVSEGNFLNNTASALAMSGTAAVALTTAGDAVTWNLIPAYLVPWQPASGGAAIKWSAVGIGPHNACAVRAAPGDVLNPTGGVRCSGQGWSHPIPPSTLDGVTDTASALAVGSYFACAIRDSNSDVICWGNGGAGTVLSPPSSGAF